MKISEALYDYFSERVDQIAKEWIETMEDSDPNSIYSLTNPVIIEELMEQDKEFYRHINKMYIMPEKEFLEEFERWVIELAKDQKHLDTPVQYVVREFMRNRRLYISYYDAFADKHESSFAEGERKRWENLIVQVFDFTIYTFPVSEREKRNR
ncbi:RsbT co-antagonist protein RsbRB, partial [Bacillus siamensis]